jgi:hypothetical protein
LKSSLSTLSKKLTHWKDKIDYKNTDKYFFKANEKINSENDSLNYLNSNLRLNGNFNFI